MLFMKRKLVEKKIKRYSEELNEQIYISKGNKNKYFEDLLNSARQHTAQRNNTLKSKIAGSKNRYKWAMLIVCVFLSIITIMIIIDNAYFQESLRLYGNRENDDNFTNLQTESNGRITSIETESNAPTQSDIQVQSYTPTQTITPEPTSTAQEASEPKNTGLVNAALPYLVEISMQELKADNSLSHLVLPEYLPYDMTINRIGKTDNEKLPHLYIFIGNKEKTILYTIGEFSGITPAPFYLECKDVTGAVIKENASVFDNRVTMSERIRVKDKLIGLSAGWVLSDEDCDELAIMLQSIDYKEEVSDEKVLSDN